MTNLNGTKKPLIAILLAVTLILSSYAGVALAFISGQTPAVTGVSNSKANYAIFEGVAGNDAYSSMQYSYDVNQWAGPDNNIAGYGSWNNQIYPGSTILNPGDVWFSATKSLRLGFTEYGEFAVNTNQPLSANGNGGIAYGSNAAQWTATESFATISGIPDNLWVNGWVFYINYNRFNAGPRAFEAYALYSDSVTSQNGRQAYGWVGTVGPVDTGAGRVAGTVIPSGVQVIYDDARLVVGRVSIVCYDKTYISSTYPGGEPVAQITLTCIFEKDTKYSIILKDVKILIPEKSMQAINNFVFSERYEIDLAFQSNPTDRAYIHYYAQNFSSVYEHPLTGQSAVDVLQAFDPGRRFIFFAGYWPQATQYAMTAQMVPNPSNTPTSIPIQNTWEGYTSPTSDLTGGVLTNSMYINGPMLLNPNVQQPDANPLYTGAPINSPEPTIPQVVIQWEYNSTMWPNLLNFLAHGDQSTNSLYGGAGAREIRFVEVMGMTDYHSSATLSGYPTAGTAFDLNAGDMSNQLDAEVAYIMRALVFDPVDLTAVAGTGISDGGAASINTVAQYSPVMWEAVGQSAAPTDTAGAAFLSPIYGYYGTPQAQPMQMFDENDSTHKGTIPYALDPLGGSYMQSFSNTGTGTGNDPTTYLRTGLLGFAFGVYDNVTASPPQPIAGGWSSATGDLVFNSQNEQVNYEVFDNYYWYPSKDPLTERWEADLLPGPSWIYPGITFEGIVNPILASWHPNGIMTVGGPKANWVSRYFNDFNDVIMRETSNTAGFTNITGGVATNLPTPTSNPAYGTLDFYPLTTWNTSQVNAATGLPYPITTYGYGAGTAVIAIGTDVNGTRGISVYGWDARDTFWASAWASQYLKVGQNAWIPAGCTALVLGITYIGPNNEPTAFTILKALGTITEFGYNFFANQFVPYAPPAMWGQLQGQYGFDNNALVPAPVRGFTWDSNMALSMVNTLPFNSPAPWWYQKLPTYVTATVAFDP